MTIMLQKKQIESTIDSSNYLQDRPESITENHEINQDSSHRDVSVGHKVTDQNTSKI